MRATTRKGMHPTQGAVPVRVAAELRAGSPEPTAVLEAGGEQPSGYYPVDVFTELLQGDPCFERAVAAGRLRAEVPFVSLWAPAEQKARWQQQAREAIEALKTTWPALGEAAWSAIVERALRDDAAMRTLRHELLGKTGPSAMVLDHVLRRPARKGGWRARLRAGERWTGFGAWLAQAAWGRYGDEMRRLPKLSKRWTAIELPADPESDVGAGVEAIERAVQAREEAPLVRARVAAAGLTAAEQRLADAFLNERAETLADAARILGIRPDEARKLAAKIRQRFLQP